MEGPIPGTVELPLLDVLSTNGTESPNPHNSWDKELDSPQPNLGEASATPLRIGLDSNAPANSQDDFDCAWRLVIFSRECHSQHLTQACLDVKAHDFNTTTLPSSYSKQYSTTASQQAPTSKLLESSLNENTLDRDQADEYDSSSYFDRPPDPNMNRKTQISKKTHMSLEPNIQYQYNHLPARTYYTDRSLTVSMTPDELAMKYYEMNHHPSAREFQDRQDLFESESKPTAGRMRSEDNAEVKKKGRIMNKAIGYPTGPPEDRPELMDDWLHKSMDYLQKQAVINHAEWPQQEAADKEIERMRKGFIPGTMVVPSSGLKRRERAEKRAERRANDQSRLGNRRSSPVDDKEPDKTQNSRKKDGHKHTSPLVQPASSPLSGTMATDDILNSENLSQAQYLSNSRRDMIAGTSKKRKQSQIDDKLESNLAGYWEARLDATGRGRPKKQPRRD